MQSVKRLHRMTDNEILEWGEQVDEAGSMRIMILLAALALTACANTPAREQSLSVAVGHFAEQTSPQYKHAFVDLNNDGVSDAIVLLQGMGWCGSGGCTMLILRGGDAGYAVVSRSTVTKEPVRVAQSVSHGWRDIIVHSDGAEKLMRFAGNGYPLNPSMQSAATQEQADSAKIVLP